MGRTAKLTSQIRRAFRPAGHETSVQDMVFVGGESVIVPMGGLVQHVTITVITVVETVTVTTMAFASMAFVFADLVLNRKIVDASPLVRCWRSPLNQHKQPMQVLKT